MPIYLVCIFFQPGISIPLMTNIVLKLLSSQNSSLAFTFDCWRKCLPTKKPYPKVKSSSTTYPSRRQKTLNFLSPRNTCFSPSIKPEKGGKTLFSSFTFSRNETFCGDHRQAGNFVFGPLHLGLGRSCFFFLFLEGAVNFNVLLSMPAMSLARVLSDLYG